jgi:thioredoxin-dependent peroxiredoxin
MAMVWIPGFGRYSPRDGNRVGDLAPDFTLKDQDARDVHLADELGEKPVVLVFYPRASSPICTKQMCSLRNEWSDLMGKVKIFGLSYDPPADLKKFIERDKLPFTLLSDPNKEAAKKYGVAGTFAAARVTFVIGTDRRIKAVIDSINATGHAEQVLQAL